MYSSWVIMSIGPSSGSCAWTPRPWRGCLPARGIPDQEGPEVQLTATFGDRRCRVSLIAEHDFRRLQNASFGDRAHAPGECWRRQQLRGTKSLPAVRSIAERDVFSLLVDLSARSL